MLFERTAISKKPEEQIKQLIKICKFDKTRELPAYFEATLLQAL